MLRNCKVSRALPRIVDCAKNDRNAVLRARSDSVGFLVSWSTIPCGFVVMLLFPKLGVASTHF